MRWLLLLSAAALAGCNSDKIAQLEKQNKELSAKLDGFTKETSLDRQERCAKQARAEYNAQGMGKKEFAGFTNHYNAKVDKCFMEISDMPGANEKPFVPTSYRNVSDAFEGKVYAEYFWRNDKGKKYWEVAPFMCKVTTLSGEEVICKTTDEFDNLIKQFMEQ